MSTVLDSSGVELVRALRYSDFRNRYSSASYRRWISLLLKRASPTSSHAPNAFDYGPLSRIGDTFCGCPWLAWPGTFSRGAVVERRHALLWTPSPPRLGFLQRFLNIRGAFIIFLLERKKYYRSQRCHHQRDVAPQTWFGEDKVACPSLACTLLTSGAKRCRSDR